MSRILRGTLYNGNKVGYDGKLHVPIVCILTVFFLSVSLIILKSVIVCAADGGVQGAAIDDAPKSSGALEGKDKIGLELPVSSSMQKKVSKSVEGKFGSDQNVESLPGEPMAIGDNLKDIDRQENYNYKTQECNRLLADVVQQLGIAVQKEIVKVTKISEAEETSIGLELAKQFETEFKGKMDVDEQWVKYVRAMGEKLTSRVNRGGLNYHFHVIRSKQINAFAIPGGGVYVYTGMLEKIKNEAQLAALLAHEIKHIDLRHCIALYQVVGRLPGPMQNKMSFVAAKMIEHPFHARTEAEADRRALELIYSFGYSPYQFIRIWESDIYGESSRNKKNERGGGENRGLFGDIVGQVLEEVETVVSSHPNYDKRACLLRNHIVKLQEKYGYDPVYVGAWNYKNKMPMFNKQN